MLRKETTGSGGWHVFPLMKGSKCWKAFIQWCFMWSATVIPSLTTHIWDLIVWVCNHKNCENFFVMLEQWGWKRMYTFVRNTICVCDCVWILFISPFLQWNINKLLEIILSRWSFLLTSIQYVNWSNLIVIKRVSFNHKKSCFILKCLIMVKRF